MRFFISLTIIVFISGNVFSQEARYSPPQDSNKSLLSKEILEHYQSFNINQVRKLQKIMDTDMFSFLAQSQTLLNNFYAKHPGNFKDSKDINIENSLEHQGNPEYKVNPRLDMVLEKLKQKQIPGLIKNAPNIFELHYGMGKGLMKAETTGVLFTKNPVRAAYHYLTALRYRSLKLSPEIWVEQDRLLLIDDSKEKEDAKRYLDVLKELSTAENEYQDTKRKMFSEEDNLVRTLKDPGNNEPLAGKNKKILADLEIKIQSLKTRLAKETQVFESYAQKYNKFSADYLLELSDIILSIDNNTTDNEKILNEKEYYRASYNFTFNQLWRLESRRASYINLLEMASLLDPENAKTMFKLGKEYYRSADQYMSISSFENALKTDNKKPNLTTPEKLEIFNSLGGLYYSTKRFVDAAWHYTQALKIHNSNSTKLQLARIHTENTGNYSEAEKLLNDLIAKSPETTETNPVEHAVYLKHAFTIYELLITVYQKTMGKDMLMNTLDKSKTIHERLNLMISENYDALREREKSLAEAKANLYINPDDLAMQNFYTIEFDYENQKKTLQKLESIRNSMNFKKIYFTMAYESEMAHNIKGAIEAFRIAESFGLDPDYARREILRLQGKYKGNL